MGPARPKVKVREGDKPGVAHAGLLPPYADCLPVPRYLLQAATWDLQAENVATVSCWGTGLLGSPRAEGLV